MKKLLSSILLVCMLVMSIGVFSGCAMFGPLDVKIELPDVDITIGSSTKDLYDAGYDLAEYDHPNAVFSENSLPEIDAKSIEVAGSYYIYKDGKSTGVSVQLMNNSNESKTIDDCKIYDIKVYTIHEESYEYVPVTVNGKDITGMTPDEAVEYFTELGCKFESDESDNFTSGDATKGFYVSYKQGDFVYSLEKDTSSSTGEIVLSSFEMYQVVDHE